MAYQQLPENMYYNPFKDKNTNDEQREKMKIIMGNILQQLTERQREAILLYHQGKSYGEIAEVMNISKQTAADKVKAAMKKIDEFKKIFENVSL